MPKTTIIAEAGVNHDGRIKNAIALCDTAKEAGADIVKFQTYIPEKCIRPGKDYDLLKRLALSLPAFHDIAKYCREIDIEFCSTPDDLESLKYLVEHCGVKRIKLGSGSLLYEPLVTAAFSTGLPVLLSTGMATMEEVAGVLQHQYKNRTVLSDVTVMHCVSLYPCPPELANVAALHTVVALAESVWPMDWFHIGYSDHTVGYDSSAAAAAVAIGATVIEKHITLGAFRMGADAGPDHPMSATRHEFHRMVNAIRDIEKVLGTGIKMPSEKEREMIPHLRKDSEGFQPGSLSL